MALIIGSLRGLNCSAAAQAFDFGVQEPKLAQHLESLLAAIGCGALEPAWRARHIDRLSDEFDGAAHGMLDLLREAEGLDLFVGEHLVDAVNRSAWHAGT